EGRRSVLYLKTKRARGRYHSDSTEGNRGACSLRSRASPCKGRPPNLIGRGMAAPAERLPNALASDHRRRRERKRRGPGPVRARIEYLVLRAVVGFLGMLPLWLALRVGELAAFFAYVVDVPHRRIGMRNLGIAFPDRPLRARRGILVRSFLNLGRMAAELAHLPRLSPERLLEMVRFDDEEWWREAVTWERSTGVLALSGHF